jgi:hypothetical protein
LHLGASGPATRLSQGTEEDPSGSLSNLGERDFLVTVLGLNWGVSSQTLDGEVEAAPASGGGDLAEVLFARWDLEVASAAG